MKAIRSKKYLAGSRGKPCTFRIPGHCNNDWSTVVPCHIRDRHTGAGIKASDISVANGCSGCHDAMDGRSIVLSREDWLFYALRGLQETLEQRISAGLLTLPQDLKAPASKAKPRAKSKWPQGRKIQSRPFDDHPSNLSLKEKWK